jgi:ABC-type multidrug transport system fused ATPase/permease subunit
LDENGGGLSTGQKQRLSLARALLRQPLLLVLDEATANLDLTTELEIAETIRLLRGRSTVLIVSHRPGILEVTDQTLRMGKQSIE